jgi:hypothetical protein
MAEEFPATDRLQAVIEQQPRLAPSMNMKLAIRESLLSEVYECSNPDRQSPDYGCRRRGSKPGATQTPFMLGEKLILRMGHPGHTLTQSERFALPVISRSLQATRNLIRWMQTQQISRYRSK